MIFNYLPGRDFAAGLAINVEIAAQAETTVHELIEKC